MDVFIYQRSHKVTPPSPESVMLFASGLQTVCYYDVINYNDVTSVLEKYAFYWCVDFGFFSI